MKHFFILTIILALGLTACTSIQAVPDMPVSSTDEPAGAVPVADYAPQPADVPLAVSEVSIDSAQLLLMESYPLQVNLAIKGALPTPCHTLRVRVEPPDKKNNIRVEVYAVSDPAEMCVQLVAPFQVNVSLGSFPSGKYIVWVNGDKAGVFEV